MLTNLAHSLEIFFIMKKCTKCWVESNNFSPCKKNKDGLYSQCRDCKNIATKSYSRTKDGLVTSIYSHQRRNSRMRWDSIPNYTLQELREWVFSQNNFEELYISWKESKYDKQIIPSIDRIDDYRWYSFDNIRQVTWEENRKRSYEDRRNWINNKLSTAVIWNHKYTWEVLEFYSIAEAKRRTGIWQSEICNCCKWIRKSAGNYIWKYK